MLIKTMRINGKRITLFRLTKYARSAYAIVKYHPDGTVAERCEMISAGGADDLFEQMVSEERAAFVSDVQRSFA